MNENLEISDVRSCLYQLKQRLEDKRISDKETLKLIKKIENQIKNLETYKDIYTKLEKDVYVLFNNNTSLSEIGVYVTIVFGCK